MALSAVNNTTAFNVYTNYLASQTAIDKSMTRLATGEKLTSDDGAAVSISERMRSQASSTAMARQNTDNAISMLQTADSWLQRTNDMLARMHELAVESNDATKTDDDRANIQTEFQELQSEIGRIADTAAKFNGKMLFGSELGSGVYTQVGADQGQTIKITFKDLRSSGTSTAMDVNGASVSWQDILDKSTTSVSTTANAITAIKNIQSAIDFISKSRASLGGQQARFEHTRSGLLTYEDNLRAAESKVRDVDIARESSEFASKQILSQVGNAMLAQANQLPQGIMQLIG